MVDGFLYFCFRFKMTIIWDIFWILKYFLCGHSLNHLFGIIDMNVPTCSTVWKILILVRWRKWRWNWIWLYRTQLLACEPLMSSLFKQILCSTTYTIVLRNIYFKKWAFYLSSMARTSRFVNSLIVLTTAPVVLTLKN